MSEYVHAWTVTNGDVDAAEGDEDAGTLLTRGVDGAYVVV